MLDESMLCNRVVWTLSFGMIVLKVETTPFCKIVEEGLEFVKSTVGVAGSTERVATRRKER